MFPVQTNRTVFINNSRPTEIPLSTGGRQPRISREIPIQNPSSNNHAACGAKSGMLKADRSRRKQRSIHPGLASSADGQRLARQGETMEQAGGRNDGRTSASDKKGFVRLGQATARPTMNLGILSRWESYDSRTPAPPNQPLQTGRAALRRSTRRPEYQSRGAGTLWGGTVGERGGGGATDRGEPNAEGGVG